MPATGRPTIDQRDYHLRHRADQPLNLKNVEPPAFCFGASSIDARRVGVLDIRIVLGGVLVPGAAANALISARAERPPTVLRRRTIAR